MKNLSEVKESIIAAAEKHFSVLGFEKTTLDDISAENGKSKTSVYYHFKNKHDIFKAVIEKEFRELKDTLDPIVSVYRSSGSEMMRSYLRKRLESMASMGAYGWFAASRFANTDNLVSRAVNSARKSFDEWELSFFSGSALEGVPGQIFAETLSNILRALEHQYFTSRDKAAVRKTYEGLIEMVIR